MAKRTVLPPAAKVRIAVQKPWRLSTSIATVGSSSTSRSGLLTSATAKRTRWVWPPESFCVRRPAMSWMPVSSSTSSTGERMGVERGHHLDQLAHREVAQEGARLEHRPDGARVDRRPRRRPEDRNGAGVGLEQAEQHVDRRRLACAVRPEQGDGLAAGDLEVDPAHGAHLAEGLGEIPELDAGGDGGRDGRDHATTLPSRAGLDGAVIRPSRGARSQPAATAAALDSSIARCGSLSTSERTNALPSCRTRYQVRLSTPGSEPPL